MNSYDLVERKDNKPTQSKLKQAVKVGVATAVSTVLMAQANAAEITSIGAGLSDEIDGSKALVIALFGAGAIILGLFAGYRYLKRGANSA